MNWQNAANISQTIGIFVAIVALIFTYIQLRANSRQKAAEFIIGLNNTIFQHRHISEIYYKIEKINFNMMDSSILMMKSRSRVCSITLKELLNYIY